MLASYGIPVVPTRVARDEDEAIAAAREMGFPVAVKLWSRVITHKTDVGGVKLGLGGRGRRRARVRGHPGVGRREGRGGRLPRA